MARSSSHTFWLGRYKDHDAATKMAQEMIQSMEQNTWTSPLFVDGAGWRQEPVRQDAAMGILQALRTNTSAKTFLFQNVQDMNDDMDEAFAQALKDNNNLETVKLRNLTTSSGEEDNATSYYKIPSSVFENKNLKTLSLAKLSLHLDACRQLGDMISESTSLTTLGLDSVQVADPEGWIYIFAGLVMSRSLHTLTLNNMKLVDKPRIMSRLLLSLACNHTIEHLHLEGMELDAKHGSELANLLQQNKKVTHLSLRKNKLDGAAMELMVSGLAQNTTLRSLRLSRNPLDDNGASHLAQHCIAASPNLPQEESGLQLQELCLADTQVGVQGSLAVAQALETNSHLQTLHMDGNRDFFQHSSCSEQMLKSLQSNSSLHAVWDRKPRRMATTQAWNEVEFLLRANQKHRGALLRDTASQVLLPNVLAGVAKAEEADVLFYFLQNSVPHCL